MSKVATTVPESIRGTKSVRMGSMSPAFKVEKVVPLALRGKESRKIGDLVQPFPAR